MVKLSFNKHSISFKLSELNYLLAVITTIENRLARYVIAQNDVIIIIFIYCNWVVTLWQWLFYMYTKLETGYY